MALINIPGVKDPLHHSVINLIIGAGLGLVSILALREVFGFTPPNGPPPGDKGIVVFAYFGYSTGHPWNIIFQTKQRYPRVNIICVANPANGTNPRDPNVGDMKRACARYGIPVIGYIGTGFDAGWNRVQYVRDTARIYREVHGLDGVFLDETDGCGACLQPGGAYQQMADYCHNILGMKYVVGNPGGDCNSGGQDRYFDIVCMWEPGVRPTAQQVCNCPVPLAKKGVIPHSQSSPDLNRISQIMDCASYYYEVTQFNAWHVPGAFPPWFEDIARIIDSKL